MNCPICTSEDTQVLRSVPKDDGTRRIRGCKACGHRFATRERLEAAIAADEKALATARELAAVLVPG